MTPKTSEDVVREVLERVAVKWALLALEGLGEGPLRFTQLRDKIGDVSQKMLTKTLRELERDGLVSRHVHAVVPPRVDYALTPLGESLSAALCGVWVWVEENWPAVEAARQAYAARAED